VVIKPQQEEGQTETGLYIPETAQKDKPQQGEVVAVGDGRVLDNGERVSVAVNEGDTVYFTKFGPNEVEVDGEEHLIAEEKDILAVVSQ
jgi:chaperonin GroES